MGNSQPQGRGSLSLETKTKQLAGLRDDDGLSQHASIIDSVSNNSQVFFFSYSPSLESLLAWSGNSEQIFGTKEATLIRGHNLFLSHTLPEDRHWLLPELDLALDGKKNYRVTYRWIRPDNEKLLWLHARASLAFNEFGKVLNGVIFDVSQDLTLDSDSSSELLPGLITALDRLLIVLDLNFRIKRVFLPKNFTGFADCDYGFCPERLQPGYKFLSCFSEDIRKVFGKTLNSALKHGGASLQLKPQALQGADLKLGFMRFNRLNNPDGIMLFNTEHGLGLKISI